KAMAVSAVREVDETGGWPLVPRVARVMPDLAGGLWARVGLLVPTPPMAQAKPANSMTRALAFFIIMAFPKNRSRSCGFCATGFALLQLSIHSGSPVRTDDMGSGVRRIPNEAKILDPTGETKSGLRVPLFRTQHPREAAQRHGAFLTAEVPPG